MSEYQHPSASEAWSQEALRESQKASEESRRATMNASIDRAHLLGLLRWVRQNLQPWDGGTLFVKCQCCSGDKGEWSHSEDCPYVKWEAEVDALLLGQ